MKRQILFLALLFLTGIQSFSQIIFENGYFVNDSNQKIECLIKNIDWNSNPTEFEYKLSADTQPQKASIETVNEFGINGASKFVRSTVQIDRSPRAMHSMSSDKNPNFLTEQLFLKVLIEGEATLYLYKDGDLIRFFFNVNDSEIKQLIFKRYLIGSKVAENNSFRQQLFVDLKCPSIMSNDVETLRYVKRELVRLFMKFNECTKSDYTNYEVNKTKDLFTLSFRPGINYSELAIVTSDSRDIDFGSKFSFRLGIEAEFILPFNKSKWGIIMEPTYQYYKGTKATEANVSGGVVVSRVNYRSIELPVGIRHYFFFNDRSKIFADLSCIFDFNTNSSMTLTRSDGSMLNSLEIKSRTNLGLGVGYKHVDRYSLSMRYQTGREILSNYLSWNSSYRTFSVIVGYSLL